MILDLQDFSIHVQMLWYEDDGVYKLIRLGLES